MANEKFDMLMEISNLLDDALKAYDEMYKSDLKLQPDENGDMAQVAGQASDDAIKPLKKEEDKKEMPPVEEKKEDEEKKDEAKPFEGKETPEEEKKEAEEMKAEAPIPPAEEKKDEPKPEEKEEEEEDEKDGEEKIEKYIMDVVSKALVKMGLVKSEKEIVEESTINKSLDERFAKIEESVKKVAEAVEKIGSKPAPRKSLDGYSAIKKSMEESEEAPKTYQDFEKAKEKLLELQKNGDKRVSNLLITKFETSRDFSLIKDLI